MENGYYLGVDGGATRNKLVLFDTEGNKVFETTGACLNFRNIPEKVFVENMRNLLRPIEGKKILSACFSLAGVEIEEDKSTVSKLIKKTGLANFPFIVVNDLATILPALDAQEGAVIIAGTGSNFYAKKGSITATSGGLGYFLADEGSAFWIGQKVLMAAVRSADGRGEKTLLENMVLEKTGVNNIRDLVALVYNEDFKLKVAEFALLPQKAVERNDHIAHKILDEAVDELFRGVETVITSVGLKEGFKIIIAGGVFNDRYISPWLTGRLNLNYPGVEILRLKNPELGAVRLAVEASGKKLKCNP